MSPVFQINFRRDAYQKDIARARRRVLLLGLWVAYFGAIVVVIGLYGLNCAVVMQRAGQVERQAQRLRAMEGTSADTRLSDDDLAQIERYVRNPRQWRDRLARVATLIPAAARLVSISANPSGLEGSAHSETMLITGVLRTPPGEDRMKGVMNIAGVLRADPVFARGYENVRLSSTRILSGPDALTEFTIECR